MGRRQFVVIPCLTALLLAVGTSAVAQDQLPDEATGLVPSRPYVSVLPWEKIDVFSGGLVLTFTDLVLPGNAGFDLRVNRVYNMKKGGGWQIGPGFIKDADVIEGWDGVIKPPVIVSEDGGERLTFRAWEGSVIYRTLGYGEYDREAYSLRQPDGTVYEYDCYWPAQNQRFPTRIWDAFTNEITIAYDSCDPTQATRPKLASIVQELGNGQSRTVTFTYDGDHLHTMSYLGRTWIYNWIGDLLTSVDLPVGGSWTFGYWGTWVHSVTTPNGGAVEYLFNAALENPPVEARFWGNAGWGFERRSAPSTGDFEVVVANQLNTTIYTFPYNSPFPGTPSVRVVKDGDGQEAEREDLFWLESAAVGLEEVVDGQIRRPVSPLLQQRRITRGGVQWYTTYYYHDATTFNDYGQPWQIQEAGDVAGRTTLREFWDSPSQYIRGKISKVTVSGGGESYETSWDFRDDGFVNSKTVFGVTTTYGADWYGKVACETDANNNPTSYGYSWGVVNSIVAPGHAISRQINEDGTIAWEERGGFRYVFTYDDLGRETNRRLQNGANANSPVNNDVQTDYGADRVTTTRGSSWTRTSLDGYGRTVGTENAAGVRTAVEYNGWGGRSFESLPFTGASGPGTTFTYDALGRVTQESKAGGAVTYEYSLDGRSVTIKDEKDHPTTQRWEAVGHPSRAHLASVTDGDGQTTNYTYDVLGTLTNVSHPDESSRSWVYGAHHWLESETHPESGTVTYGYAGDHVGNVKSRTDDNGVVLTYTYDGDNRVTDITANVGGGRDDAHFAYDGWGNRYEVSNSYASRVLTFEADRLIESTEWIRPSGTGDWSAAFVTDYTADGNDNVTSIRYPGGARRLVRYSYDNANRVILVFDDERTYASDFAYHPSGALAGFTSGNGVVNTITYDEPHGRYWVHDVAAAKPGSDPVLALHYSYDDVGNVEGITGAASGAQSFEYDSLDRLTSGTGPWGSESFRYDGVGNRLWKNEPTGTEYHYTGNRLTGTSGADPETFSYDNVGNLTGDARGTYTYTPFNMLRQATMQSGVTTVSQYDGDQQRAVNTVAGVDRFSLRGGGGPVLSEVTRAGGVQSWARDYIYAGTRLIASIGASGSEPGPGGPGPFNKTTPGNGALVAAMTVPLGWTTSALATSYEYCVSLTSGCPGAWTDAGPATTAVATGLAPGTTYYWQVRARNSDGTTVAGESWWSFVIHRAPPDFNGDGKADLVWRNYTTGANALWEMDGRFMLSNLFVPPVADTNWQAAAVADFNGDGRADIVWRHAVTGSNAVWCMNRSTVTADWALPPVPNTAWQIVAAADFTGDGEPDLLWRNQTTGANVVWVMDGLVAVTSVTLPAVADGNFVIAGAADVNGDGWPDIVWRNKVTGGNAVWYMDGLTMVDNWALPPVLDTAWEIATVGDLDGDGHPDLVWRNRTTAGNAVWFLDGLNVTGDWALPPVPDANWWILRHRW